MAMAVKPATAISKESLDKKYVKRYSGNIAGISFANVSISKLARILDKALAKDTGGIIATSVDPAGYARFLKELKDKRDTEGSCADISALPVSSQDEGLLLSQFEGDTRVKYFFISSAGNMGECLTDKCNVKAEITSTDTDVSLARSIEKSSKKSHRYKRFSLVALLVAIFTTVIAISNGFWGSMWFWLLTIFLYTSHPLRALATPNDARIASLACVLAWTAHQAPNEERDEQVAAASAANTMRWFACQRLLFGIIYLVMLVSITLLNILNTPALMMADGGIGMVNGGSAWG